MLLLAALWGVPRSAAAQIFAARKSASITCFNIPHHEKDTL